MDWADAHSVGYAPWAWWSIEPDVVYYALLQNDDGTPRAPLGTTYKNHLAGLPPDVPDPCPTREVPLVPLLSSWVPDGPVCLATGGSTPPVEAERSLIGLSGTARGTLVDSTRLLSRLPIAPTEG